MSIAKGPIRSERGSYRRKGRSTTIAETIGHKSGSRISEV